MKFRSLVIVFVLMMALGLRAEVVHVFTFQNASNRVHFGVEMLSNALKSAGYSVGNAVPKIRLGNEKFIIVIEKNDPSLKQTLKQLNVQLPDSMKKEGFFIATKKNTTLICGNDGNGAIYGCREVIDRLHNSKNSICPFRLLMHLKW
jgi:hypothetical protein